MYYGIAGALGGVLGLAIRFCIGVVVKQIRQRKASAQRLEFFAEEYPQGPAFLDVAQKWYEEHMERLMERGFMVSPCRRSYDTSHDSIVFDIDSPTFFSTIMVYESGMTDFHSARLGEDVKDDAVLVEHFEFQSPEEVAPALDAFIKRLM